MEENEIKKISALETKAFQIFEERNRAFRILFDTAITIENVGWKEIFQILCQNLRKICRADWAALASFNNKTRKFTLEHFDSSQHTININPAVIGQESREIIDADIESLKKERICKCESQHICCLIDFYSDFFGHLENAAYYRLSFVYEDELIALATVQLLEQKKLSKKDIIDIYVNMACVIMQRISTMQKLEESEERFRKLFEHSNDAIVIFDFNGNIMDANSMTQKMIGHSLNDIKNMNLFDFFPDEEKEKAQNSFRQLIDTGHIFFESQYIKSDHSLGSINVSARIIDEDIKLCEGIIRDITLRKEAEKEIRRNHNELEKANLELQKMYSNLESTHEKLKSAQIQLIRSEKMASIGQLASGIAHEVNNPTGFITSNMVILSDYFKNITKYVHNVTELKTALEHQNMDEAIALKKQNDQLEKDLDIEYILKDVTNILDESLEGLARIKRIVMDLKTFSHRGEETRTSLDVNEVIDGILNMVLNEIKHKANLVKEYGQLDMVNGNAQQLGQVFINLLINAGQAIDERGEITLKTFQENNRVFVVIQDTGTGISPEHMKNIFDPFFTTKPVGEGTGLGLSISYDIIKQHGGDIDVASELHKGSTFTVSLPTNERQKI